MAGICKKMSDWVASPFSAVVYFQKHFVDDVADTVKRQKENLDRRAREVQERAVQLHLDHLEENYLCCVCGHPGETREDEEHVYDTFSIVELPGKREIKKALRDWQWERERREADAEEDANAAAAASGSISSVGRVSAAAARIIKQRAGCHSHRGGGGCGGGAGSNASGPLSRAGSSFYDDDDDSLDEVSSPRGSRVTNHRGSGSTRRRGGDASSPTGSSSKRSHRHRRRRRASANGSDGASEEEADVVVIDFYAAADAKGDDSGHHHDAEAASNSKRSTAAVPEEEAVPVLMDPALVPPLQVQDMMYKIRHAVLNKEARTKRKSVAVHKDKGLTKIDESEIDLYSGFFQRPVHGFLCKECFTCARRRLDTVTEQVQTILFKARHPFLRRVAEKEVRKLAAAGQLSEGLVASIVDIQRRWNRSQEEHAAAVVVVSSSGGGGMEAAPRRRGRRRHGQKNSSSSNSVIGSGGGVAAFDAPVDKDADHPSADDDDDSNGDDDDDAYGDNYNSDSDDSVDSAAVGTDPSSAVPTVTMSDTTILTLRATAKCGVCQRRPSCFFNRASVLFLCEFCTARDRFYRDNAVCVNDVPMDAEVAHLLADLAKYHERVHRQQELRQLPQTELAVAPIDLFGVRASLFEIQEFRNSRNSGIDNNSGTDSDGKQSDHHHHHDDDGDDGHDDDAGQQVVLLCVEPRPYADVRRLVRTDAAVLQATTTTTSTTTTATAKTPATTTTAATASTMGSGSGSGPSKPASPARPSSPPPSVASVLDPRAVLAHTQLSLFEDTAVMPVAGMNLFRDTNKAAAQPLLFEAARSGGDGGGVADMFGPAPTKTVPAAAAAVAVIDSYLSAPPPQQQQYQYQQTAIPPGPGTAPLPLPAHYQHQQQHHQQQAWESGSSHVGGGVVLPEASVTPLGEEATSGGGGATADADADAAATAVVNAVFSPPHCDSTPPPPLSSSPLQHQQQRQQQQQQTTVAVPPLLSDSDPNNHHHNQEGTSEGSGTGSPRSTGSSYEEGSEANYTASAWL